MKKVLALILVLAMAVAFAAPAFADEAPVMKVGYFCHNEEAEYHYKVLHGCKDAFEAAGYEFTYAVTGGDAAEARAAYDLFKAKGVNVIIDFTCTATSAAAISDMCERDGIYYIAVDVFFDNLESNKFTTSFGVNNDAIGEFGGENVVAYLKDHGYESVDYILETNNSGFGEAVRARTKGVVDAVLAGDFGLTEENCYYMDITSGDQTENKQLIQDHLTSIADKYETILLLVCSTDWQAASIAAVESAGLQDKVLIFENDGAATTQAIFKKVAAGEYDGVCPLKGEVAFFPEKYAEMLMPIAEKLIAGETVDKYNHTLKGWLTAETINEIYPD